MDESKTNPENQNPPEPTNQVEDLQPEDQQQDQIRGGSFTPIRIGGL